MSTSRGYTLVELIVSVGIFAVIMSLAAGAYLIMIGAGRSAQATATGINSLAFGLEDMTRSIRTGTGYNCNNPAGGNCSAGGNSFYFTDSTGHAVSYSLSVSSTYCGTASGCLIKNVGGTISALTDPSVNVTSLMFYVSGVLKNDGAQPQVTMTISGTVSSGPGKSTAFSVETSATMRGADL